MTAVISGAFSPKSLPAANLARRPGAAAHRVRVAGAARGDDGHAGPPHKCSTYDGGHTPATTRSLGCVP